MVVVQVDRLKRHLKVRGLNTAGLKAELVKRLKAAESCAAPRMMKQAETPAAGGAGQANPEDAETARKVSIVLQACA